MIQTDMIQTDTTMDRLPDRWSKVRTIESQPMSREVLPIHTD